MSEKIYLGLDMGTSSVGWAVTDEKYNLIRRKGKDLWGVRLFEEAKTSSERRGYRTSRRRLQREKARIGYLRELFEAEINKVDSSFYQRMDDSKYFEEDKDIQQRYAIFSDENFNDKEYYKKYPTIYHLIMELITDDRPHDVRLVYLAILNIYKHRGHFLNTNLKSEETNSLDVAYNKFVNIGSEEIKIEIKHTESSEWLKKYWKIKIFHHPKRRKKS